MHRNCAIDVACEGHGICCRRTVRMASGLRILVVNNAPLPRLSHARCASIREQGKAAAILIPSACSGLRVVRSPVSLRSSPRYRVRMFSNIVNPVIVLSRTILSMGCWRWLSAIRVIGTICGCGVGVQLLEQCHRTYAHCSLFIDSRASASVTSLSWPRSVPLCMTRTADEVTCSYIAQGKGEGD